MNLSPDQRAALDQLEAAETGRHRASLDLLAARRGLTRAEDVAEKEIYRCYLAGVPIRQIADVLNISHSCLSARLQRDGKLLRR